MDKESLKRWADSLKTDLAALYLCARDDRVPFAAKLIIMLVVAYALSPIDLIPDFIPVLGYLDDLVLIPLGIWMVLRLVPVDIWRENQRRAAVELVEMKPSYWAGALIVLLWLLVILGVGIWLW